MTHKVLPQLWLISRSVSLQATNWSSLGWLVARSGQRLVFPDTNFLSYIKRSYTLLVLCPIQDVRVGSSWRREASSSPTRQLGRSAGKRRMIARRNVQMRQRFVYTLTHLTLEKMKERAWRQGDDGHR